LWRVAAAARATARQVFDPIGLFDCRRRLAQSIAVASRLSSTHRRHLPGHLPAPPRDGMNGPHREYDGRPPRLARQEINERDKMT